MSNTQSRALIERVYITRGDNCYNEEGVKNDKMIGIVINNVIHWMDDEFAYLHELEGRLAQIHAHLFDKGSYGVMSSAKAQFSVTDDNGTAAPSFKVTKITCHHDNIFLDRHSYNKRSKLNKAGARWWSWLELIETYNFSPNS